MASTAGSAIVPIFPLPDVTFFPRTLLPLHVFEARYRAMVMDALARDRHAHAAGCEPGQRGCICASFAGLVSATPSGPSQSRPASRTALHLRPRAIGRG